MSNVMTLALASLSHLEHIDTFLSDGGSNAEGKTLTHAYQGFNEDQGGGWLSNVLSVVDLQA